MAIRFISQQNIKGKTILFHAMMDLSVTEGKIDISSGRFKADLQDLKQLSSKGAKLVVFTWQGRPGKKDFLHLDQHAAAVAKKLGKKIKQFKWDEDFAFAIKQMKNGDIIFLDNVRMHPDQNFDGEAKKPEDYKNTNFVKSIAPLCDYFCNNALSQSHRSECSIIGFTAVLPSFAGPSLEKEINGLDKLQSSGNPKVLLFGGMKNADSVKLIPDFLKSGKADLVLVGGFLCELFLKAKGIEFGKTDEWISERGYLEFTDLIGAAKKVLADFGEKIFLPVDLAVDANGGRKSIGVENFPSEFLIKDIGDKTTELFLEKLKHAKTVIWNGPMGVYEEKPFIKGTRAIVEAMIASKAYTVIGGGDTETAVKLLGFKAKQFGHVSLAGKASLEYLAGKKLPGLLALEESK